VPKSVNAVPTVPALVPDKGVPTTVLPRAAVYSDHPVGQLPAKGAIIFANISDPFSVSLPVKLIPPLTDNFAVGDDVPTPIFPLAKTVSNDVPDDDATLKGLVLEPEIACTLKINDDDVAFTPENIPVSISEDVPRVVDVSHLERKPG
jgi:hypothetical protein